MHTVSAVIITHNEEKNIGRCIEALQKVAEEIIIIDSFSTDATPEICRRPGVKFLQQSWLGFGPQKNFGLQQATHNFVLALDADEVLTEKAISAINELKKNGMQHVYEFPMVSYFFGRFLRHGQEYPKYVRRLFDKTKVQWDNKLVHESLIIPPEISVVRLHAELEHYSYHTIEQYVAKANFYTTLGANELYNKRKRVYFIKLLFSPFFTFVNSCFFKLGFLDGWQGIVVAFLNAHTKFLKYIKLWELWRNKKILP